MAYTFIFMNRDRTDAHAFSLDVPKYLLWFIVALLAVLMIGGFWLAWRVIGPTWLRMEATQARETAHRQGEALGITMAELEKISHENKELKNNLEIEREARAEAETRVEIVENTRVTLEERVAELQKNLNENKEMISFYEDFFKPDTDKDIFQCYNIKAEYDGEELSYSVNFLNLEKNAKKVYDLTVKPRVLWGDHILTLEALEPLEESSKSISLAKDIRLRERFAVKMPADGLHVLDIKAYDGENQVVAHCWKTF